MKYTIKFEEELLNDYFDGFAYYENVSYKIADNFHYEFWKTIDRIKENPLQFQSRYREVKIAFTQTFPFGINFIVENDLIIVIKILHTKRFFK